MINPAAETESIGLLADAQYLRILTSSILGIFDLSGLLLKIFGKDSREEYELPFENSRSLRWA